MTSTELVPVEGAELVEKIEWSRALAPSGLLPEAYRNNPANLLLAAYFADSLGIDRINAITSIHVIKGKPSASADLIASLVRRAGHRLRVWGDDTAASAELTRIDDQEYTFTATWTLERARHAGLLPGKEDSNWRRYPAAMLRSRVVTEVARMGASDALLGVIYTPEELGVRVDATGAPFEARPITTTNPVTVAEILGTPPTEPSSDVQKEEA